jgi:predicted component of type VI protein secretion system
VKLIEKDLIDKHPSFFFLARVPWRKSLHIDGLHFDEGINARDKLDYNWDDTSVSLSFWLNGT